MKKTAFLLINLGTPSDFSNSAVRRYLKQFLSDERVIDLPYLLRKLLVNFFILPFRPQQTAKAYRKIASAEGSPLLVNSQAFKSRLNNALNYEYPVALGMRYGSPSIELALDEIGDAEKIVVLPLYPQYASATTGSSLEYVFNALKTKTNIPELITINSFYNHPDFITAQAERIKKHLNDDNFLLLSYHGLPQRQLSKSGCQSADCLDCNCLTEGKPYCYRAQCFESSRLIQQQLKLPNTKIATSFQSRLGKLPWIKPYTVDMLVSLREKGVDSLTIACPSFVADCLETLEEIGIQAREQWQALGGKSFTLVPCMNDDSLWVMTAKKLLSQAANIN